MEWWQRQYRLMEKPPGDGGDPGGGGDKPKGDPPPPAKGDKEEPEGQEPQKHVSLDVLPQELRDRPEAEQKFLLEHMMQSLGKRNKEVDQLKTQLSELKGRVDATPPKPAEPDPHEGKTITELMLEDSEAALDKYMQDRGYVKAFDDVSSRVASTEYELVRGSIDDFDEYEEDVQEILKEGNLAPTRQNVRGAYTMAVGARALAEKSARKRSGGGTIPPSPPEGPKGKEEEPKFASKLEEEIAGAHNMNAEEWSKYKGDAPLDIKLPT